jgi:hypothetical protein
MLRASEAPRSQPCFSGPAPFRQRQPRGEQSRCLSVTRSLTRLNRAPRTRRPSPALVVLARYMAAALRIRGRRLRVASGAPTMMSSRCRTRGRRGDCRVRASRRRAERFHHRQQPASRHHAPSLARVSSACIKNLSPKPTSSKGPRGGPYESKSDRAAAFVGDRHRSSASSVRHELPKRALHASIDER